MSRNGMVCIVSLSSLLLHLKPEKANSYESKFES